MSERVGGREMSVVYDDVDDDDDGVPGNLRGILPVGSARDEKGGSRAWA